MPSTSTKKEIEDLLKILNRKTDIVIEDNVDKKVKAFKKRPKRTMVFRSQKVHKFIKENKLKPGKKYLEAFILYHLFLDWCRSRKNKLTPASYRTFTGIMNLYFPKKVNRIDVGFYGLTRNFRLSVLNPAKEAAIRRYNDKVKRKNE